MYRCITTKTISIWSNESDIHSKHDIKMFITKHLASRSIKKQEISTPTISRFIWHIFIWWKVFSYIYCTLGMCTYHYYIPMSWKFLQHVKIIFVKMPHLLWQSWSLEHLTLGVCIIQLVKDWDRRYQCLERLQNTRACYEIIPK